MTISSTDLGRNPTFFHSIYHQFYIKDVVVNMRGKLLVLILMTLLFHHVNGMSEHWPANLWCGRALKSYIINLCVYGSSKYKCLLSVQDLNGG